VSFQAAWQALERDEFRTAENIAREALARSPRDGEALYLLGSTLLFEGRYREALAPLSDAAAALEQRGVRYRLGHCHLALGELERAEQVLRAETLAYPASANAHNTLGVVLANQGKREQALAAFQAALALEPRHAEAHHNAGGLLSSLGRAAEALPHLQAVAQARADSAEAHYNLGLLYQSLQRHEDAVVCLERALALAPRMPYALGYLVWSEISLCRWQAAAPHIAALRAGVRADEIAAPPFTLVGASPSPEEQRRCAERHVREQGLGALAPVPRACAQRTPRIRLAYLSADLHEHATAKLAARLFELHDRSAFELIAVSYGPDDGSPMRRRLRAAFDRFEDVRGRDDLDVARWLADAGTSLAVDLKGYTPGARPRILAYRPAPVQASFLGFPGTLGAPFIDYLIADRTVVPAGAETHYSERIVWLPGS
jgi:predicted O-linked N-acetylglucosamine transferase (SPINDLY family)